MNELEKVISLIIGLAPVPCIDTIWIFGVNLRKKHGPSVGAACHLASGVIASQAVKILLNRGYVQVVRRHFQFDAYLGKFCRGKTNWREPASHSTNKTPVSLKIRRANERA